MTVSEQNLIWIDLEMTGLDPDQDLIIEIATIVTNGDLEVLAEGPVIAVHQSDEAIAAMDEWNTKTHGSSGLIERVKASTYSHADAERETINFLRQYVAENKSPMCGNSICQDRRFLYLYMPQLERFFHYRNLDVSTLKELSRRWSPEVYRGFKKQGVHLALQDIKESIAELKYYREHFIRLP